jgi:hypothetical protein
MTTTNEHADAPAGSQPEFRISSTAIAAVLGPIERLLSHGPGYALMGIGGVLALGTLVFESGVMGAETTKMAANEAIALAIVGAVLMVAAIAVTEIDNFRLGELGQKSTALMIEAQKELSLAGLQQTGQLTQSGHDALEKTADRKEHVGTEVWPKSGV